MDGQAVGGTVFHLGRSSKVAPRVTQPRMMKTTFQPHLSLIQTAPNVLMTAEVREPIAFTKPEAVDAPFLVPKSRGAVALINASGP